MFLINFWCNKRLEQGIYMYRVRKGLRDCWSSSFKLDIEWAGYSAI